MRHRVRMGWVALAVLAAGTFARGQETPSVDEIVKKANHAAYYQGKDGRAQVTMTIVNEGSGATRTREFIILRRDADGDADGEQKLYVYFQRPADVNKMVFMVWKHEGKDDDRWLYLPALDLVKRIAATDKRTSFVGSDFYYEDVSGRGIHEDKHELVETTKSFYVLKNTPIAPESVEFAYYKVWIHKTTFLPVKTEYYGKDGRKYREYTAEKVDKIKGEKGEEYQTVTRSSMTDLNAKTKTTLEYKEVKYDIGLPEDIFTERYLRRAPTQYLR